MLEDTATNTEDWIFVARSVAKLPDSQCLASQCMEMAFSAAGDARDWVLLATTWSRDFKSAGMAASDLAIAEGRAYAPHTWIMIADVWQKELQHSAAAARCLEQAETIAESTDSWIQIAKAWMTTLQDSHAAVRCLVKARDVAKGLEYHEALEKRAPGMSASLISEAIRRLTHDADVEGYVETLQAAVSDYISRRPDVVLDLGILTGDAVESGSWGTDCMSERREGSYARYYRFTLPHAADVTFELVSNEYTYLYLISGEAHDGEVIAKDTDFEHLDECTEFEQVDIDDEVYFRDRLEFRTRISRNLPAGNYAVEVTTYYEVKRDSFNLEITLDYIESQLVTPVPPRALSGARPTLSCVCTSRSLSGVRSPCPRARLPVPAGTPPRAQRRPERP